MALGTFTVLCNHHSLNVSSVALRSGKGIPVFRKHAL